MEYMSVAEASEKWGVSLRRIQKLCIDGRIAGAKKYGNAWMLPSTVAKPGDPRRERVCATRFLPNLFIAAAIPVSEYKSDNTAECFARKGEKEQFFAEKCYFRGDYKKAAAYAETAGRYDATGLCANVTLALCALHTGDFELFCDADSRLCEIALSCGGDDVARKLAELARSVIATSLYSPERCADWIARNDLSDLPAESRAMATYVYAKYLYSVNNCDRLVGVTDTALNLGEGSYNIVYIYLNIMCALGCLGTGDMYKAKLRLSAAVEAALPCGIISPFAENYAPLEGLLCEITLGRYDMEFARIRSTYKKMDANWRLMRAKLARTSLTMLLTFREYQAARLIHDGLTEAEAAEKLGISADSFAEALRGVERKLGTRNRESLERYFG